MELKAGVQLHGTESGGSPRDQQFHWSWCFGSDVTRHSGRSVGDERKERQRDDVRKPCSFFEDGSDAGRFFFFFSSKRHEQSML